MSLAANIFQLLSDCAHRSTPFPRAAHTGVNSGRGSYRLYGTFKARRRNACIADRLDLETTRRESLVETDSAVVDASAFCGSRLGMQITDAGSPLRVYTPVCAVSPNWCRRKSRTR